jgi:Mg-chelatase subunit ChlD
MTTGRFNLTALAPIVAFCSVLLLLSACAVAEQQSEGQTQVFGVTGKGSSFVFVFDRSLSMKGSPLAAAKRELLASLAQLQRVHQFQIVFYNERPKVMQPPRMQFADENGLRAAESFVSSIIADGGTDHLAALEVAMKMAPDVIFLLTDADEPPLSPKQLDAIRRNNGGAVINVIEFKSGPDSGKASFLRTLAEQNRGEYKAIDVKTFEAGR